MWAGTQSSGSVEMSSGPAPLGCALDCKTVGGASWWLDLRTSRPSLEVDIYHQQFVTSGFQNKGQVVWNSDATLLNLFANGDCGLVLPNGISQAQASLTSSLTHCLFSTPIAHFNPTHRALIPVISCGVVWCSN